MSQTGSVRKRKDKDPSVVKTPTAAATTGLAPIQDAELDALLKENKRSNAVEWDYRIALAVITLAAFITRFWGISHPNEVVFDEVHFGKVNLADDGSEILNANIGFVVCFILPRTNLLL
jgi:dolichyl-phosphate-mannose-protein mannosyltransferase